MSMLRPAKFPFLEHEGVLAFAHRGGAGDAPENTMPAFQACVDLGYRYVETDVHRTKDGKLVAFHDDTLDRATDRSGRIRELTWSEVRQATVKGERIPLLEDVLGTWPELRVNIDPKADDAVELLANVIQKTNALDRVCVGAFSDARLKKLRRKLGPGLCTSMGPLDVLRLRLRSLRVPVGAFSAGCAQVPIKKGAIPVVDARSVRTAHHLGLQIHVWTVDDPNEMHRLLDLGVDGIITDRPSLLKDVLISRNAWA